MSDGQAGFAETSKKDWVRAAQKELSGEDPLQKLSFTTNNLSLLPYYDATDLPTALSTSDIVPGKVWVNAPKVTVTNGHDANRLALEHLQAGADGVLFELTDPEVAVDQLLSGIKLPFCSVFFYGNLSTLFVRRFAQYVAELGETKLVRGAVYGLATQDVESLRDLAADFEQFTVLGITLESSAGDEKALSEWLETLTDHLSSMDSQLRHSAVLIPLSDDLFAEVIRMRAIQLLWLCLCAAYKKNDARLFLHAWSKASHKKDNEPDANMISSVSRAVSGVLGGAHALSIEPQASDSFQSRIARNISFILHEESQLARVANSVDGSYLIESASTRLAEETWRRFQASVKR